MEEIMKFINELHEGETVRGIYLCRGKRSAETRNGKAYDNLMLQDKTGVLDGKVWDPNSQGIADYDEKDFIEVVGDVISYNNNLQLNIKQIRKAGEDEYNPADYMPTSEKNVDTMYEELLGYIGQISNVYLRQAVEYYFVNDVKFIETFKGHSAAKTVHHGFAGGLLEHTLSILKMCEYFTGAYPILNKDLLYAAALCHDIGKIKELSDFPDNDYTDDGQLLGHIIIGVEMINDAVRTIPWFPEKLASELKHCVIAHHGELEYGSPKKPALAEAFALNLADNADAKMQTLTEIFKDKSGTDWLGYNRLFESNIRRTSIE
jgi:3'-5' exoribonuclease